MLQIEVLAHSAVLDTEYYRDDFHFFEFFVVLLKSFVFLRSMIYDWRNIKDWNEASIFDLTDDIELIRKCICDDSFEMKDKDDYMNGRYWMEGGREYDFERFAVETHDDELMEHLHVVFADFYEMIENLPEGVGLE